MAYIFHTVWLFLSSLRLKTDFATVTLYLQAVLRIPGADTASGSSFIEVDVEEEYGDLEGTVKKLRK